MHGVGRHSSNMFVVNELGSPGWKEVFAHGREDGKVLKTNTGQCDQQ